MLPPEKIINLEGLTSEKVDIEFILMHTFTHTHYIHDADLRLPRKTHMHTQKNTKLTRYTQAKGPVDPGRRRLRFSVLHHFKVHV